jgi:hypothetical protein
MFMLPKVAVGGLKLAITERGPAGERKRFFASKRRRLTFAIRNPKQGGGSSPSPGRGTLRDDPALHPAAHIFVAPRRRGSRSATACPNMKSTWRPRNLAGTRVLKARLRRG